MALRLLRNRVWNGLNDIIASHADADGLGGAAYAEWNSRRSELGSIVVIDSDPEVEATDALIEYSLEQFTKDEQEEKILNNVYIIDRAMCSEEMVKKLKEEYDVEMIVHIDHHPTNAPLSEELMAKYPGVVTRFYDSKYSGTWLTWRHLVGHHDDSINKEALAILIDGYDTFKWTECIGMSEEEQIEYIYNVYAFDSENIVSEVYDAIMPFHQAPVNLNYALKFEDLVYFYEELYNAIDFDRFLPSYGAVYGRYQRMQEKALEDLEERYQAVKDGSTKEIRIVNVPQKGNPSHMARLFMPDMKVPYEVLGVAAHYFLQDKPNMILLTRSVEVPTGYSIRSTGDLDASVLAVALGGGGHPNACGFGMKAANAIVDMAKEDIAAILDSKLEQLYV